MSSNLTASSNTVIGHQAMVKNNSGIGNTVIGQGAYSSKTGNYNIAIGYHAYYSTGNVHFGRNNIVIGSEAQVEYKSRSHQVRIGNTQISNASIQVDWSISSDIRWKKNVRDIPYGLNFVMGLHPVDYIRKGDLSGKREMGFIAQELDTLVGEIGYDNQGFLTKNDSGYFNVRYNDFIPLLAKAIQEQQVKIAFLESELEQIQNTLALGMEERIALAQELDETKKYFSREKELDLKDIKVKNIDLSQLPVIKDDADGVHYGLSKGMMYITPTGDLRVKL